MEGEEQLARSCAWTADLGSMRVMTATSLGREMDCTLAGVAFSTTPKLEELAMSHVLLEPSSRPTPDRRLSVRANNKIVLALDLGTTTGWAMAPPEGGIVSGTVSFRPSRYDGGGMRYLRFRAWLGTIVDDAGAIGE